ncbi:MAG: nucleotidyltransferase domain-containing protein [Lachnospiraceae bacterium]|nr:nucleotidyltransferase domain-containing protein [Lachnospiraceae bacterium]
MKKRLEERNKKIIDAIVKKAEKVCPGSLALIGVYGSFMTGDIYEKSDLDLLILINDDNGWQLGCTFIQDDLMVGHDLYCTDWKSLQQDACYEHPNISKLMDAKIVYCADEIYVKRLQELRENVVAILDAPFTKQDFDKSVVHLKNAEHFYTEAMISGVPSEVWTQAANVICNLQNAVAMLNKKYFHYGVKRTYEELEAMHYKPQKFCELIEAVISAESLENIKRRLTVLIKETKPVFANVEMQFATPKSPASADNLRGTYEEMYSNWRNKMYYAAEKENKYLAFMSMNSFQTMLSEIAQNIEIESYNVLDGYNSSDLLKTSKVYDMVLEAYRNEYTKVGMSEKHYADIDAFVEDYLK